VSQCRTNARHLIPRSLTYAPTQPRPINNTTVKFICSLEKEAGKGPSRRDRQPEIVTSPRPTEDQTRLGFDSSRRGPATRTRNSRSRSACADNGRRCRRFRERPAAGRARPSAYSSRVLILSNPDRTIIKLMVLLCPRAGLGRGESSIGRRRFPLRDLAGASRSLVFSSRKIVEGWKGERVERGARGLPNRRGTAAHSANRSDRS